MHSMEDAVHPTSSLTRDESKRFHSRVDGPAVRLFAGQLLAFATLSVLVLELAAAASPLRWPAVAADGLVLLMFFASMHEAGHGTAFATPWMNRAATWISAVLMLQSPTFFREFHFEHHRSTSDPERDPEIAGAPSMLGPWPSNPFVYLMLAAGQHLMLGKAFFTIASAVLPLSRYASVFPYVRPAFRTAVAWESRFVVLVWAAALWLGLSYVSGFAFLLLAWPIAHVGLGLFVMPEHTGLARGGSQLHRTRSMRTNALVQKAMWHMSWHAEHHEYPAVPFHRLPSLHARFGSEVENETRGYLAFHAEALRRSLSR
jgi:fatty acid desaturase